VRGAERRHRESVPLAPWQRQHSMYVLTRAHAAIA